MWEKERSQVWLQSHQRQALPYLQTFLSETQQLVDQNTVHFLKFNCSFSSLLRRMPRLLKLGLGRISRSYTTHCLARGLLTLNAHYPHLVHNILSALYHPYIEFSIWSTELIHQYFYQLVCFMLLGPILVILFVTKSLLLVIRTATYWEQVYQHPGHGWWWELAQWRMRR